MSLPDDYFDDVAVKIYCTECKQEKIEQMVKYHVMTLPKNYKTKCSECWLWEELEKEST